MAEPAVTQTEQAQPQEPTPAGEEDVRAWIGAGRGRKAIEGHSEGAPGTPADTPDSAEAKEASSEGEKSEPEKEKTPDQKHQERLDKGFAELKRQKKEVAKRDRLIQSREATLAEAQRELQTERELLKSDPYAFMRRHGISARDVAKKAIDEQETPEQQTLRELKSSNDELKREIEELRGYRQKTEQDTEQQQNQRIVQGFIKESADDYPMLLDENPAEILAALETVYERDYKPAGLSLDRDALQEILAGFETNLRSKAESLAQRLAAKKPGGPAQASPSERGNGAVEPAKPEATEAPQALSNLDAASRATPPRPLTRQERAERAAQKLRFVS
jgi:hypothetical protein